MHLVSEEAQVVHLGGREFRFAQGEKIITEYLLQTHPGGLRALAAQRASVPPAPGPIRGNGLPFSISSSQISWTLRCSRCACVRRSAVKRASHASNSDWATESGFASLQASLKGVSGTRWFSYRRQQKIRKRDRAASDGSRFERGKTTVLIGPSGCGKSTILRLIIRLLEPDAGRIQLRRATVTPENITELRRRIGYVIQDGGLFPHLTARKNMLLMARHLKKPEAEWTAVSTSFAALTRFPEMPSIVIRANSPAASASESA